MVAGNRVKKRDNDLPSIQPSMTAARKVPLLLPDLGLGPLSLIETACSKDVKIPILTLGAELSGEARNRRRSYARLSRSND